MPRESAFHAPNALCNGADLAVRRREEGENAVGLADTVAAKDDGLGSVDAFGRHRPWVGRRSGAGQLLRPKTRRQEFPEAVPHNLAPEGRTDDDHIGAPHGRVGVGASVTTATASIWRIPAATA